MKKELIDPNNPNYYYKVLGKMPIKPTVRVVKDKPFLPDKTDVEEFDITWSFSVFNGKAKISVDKNTTVLDILKEIEPGAFLFSDQTYVSSISVDLDNRLITVKLTQIGTE